MSASSKKKLRKEQNAAALTEKQLQQQKEAKKLKGQTITFVVIVALVLALGLGSLAVTAYKNSGIIERNTTALTIGEHKLSAAELSYFYFDTITSQYNEWYNTYGENTAAYLALIEGLDVNKPLDEQIYDKNTQVTFAQFFVDSAIQRAINAYTMYDLAVADGNINKEYIDFVVDATIAEMVSSSKSEGYSNLTRFLKANYGNGASEKSFRKYVEVQNVADVFNQETYESLTYTAEDLDTYNNEHIGEFYSYTYASLYVSVNDHLICDADENDSGHEHTQKERDLALLEAEKTVSALENANISTVEEFNAFIKTLDVYKDMDNAFCTENKDVLYSNIQVEEIAKWLADSSRKPGDFKVFPKTNETTNEQGQTVSVPYGFDAILYQGQNKNDTKLVNVRHILKQFTNPTTDPEGNTVYTDAEQRKEEITKLMNDWVNGGKGEEAFGTLASSNTDDTGSLFNGGLYENIYPGQMVSAFNDWCFDEARQPGDYEIIETEYGYHLMYFSGHSDVTFRDFMIENTLRNQDYKEWQQEQIDNAKYTVNDTSKLKTNIIINAN